MPSRRSRVRSLDLWTKELQDDIRGLQSGPESRYAKLNDCSKGSLPSKRSNAIYEPLKQKDSIRLLFLEPSAEADDPIECTIIHARLGDHPSYQALSYEWGPQDAEHDPSITINGKHRLRVRKNLFEGLKEIRRTLKESKQALWVDAICIDQEKSHGEKPHQVKLMGDIFSQAELVITWLGVSSGQSDMAMDTLNVFSQYKPLFHESASPFFDAWYSYLSHVGRDPILALCNRSYWRRVWIVQEIQLARSIVIRCGSKAITDVDFQKALDFFESSYSIGNKEKWQGSRSLRDFGVSIAESLPFKHLHARKMPRRSLGEWIRICSDGRLASTEPRDYIYALLGISVLEDETGETPLVSKGLPTYCYPTIDYDTPLDILYRQALHVLRYGATTEAWLSAPSGCAVAQYLAEGMGLPFDYEDHVRTFQHDDINIRANIDSSWTACVGFTRNVLPINRVVEDLIINEDEVAHRRQRCQERIREWNERQAERRRATEKK